MDLTVLNLAVPHLSADLRPSSAQLLWIVDIYGFLLAGSLITMGTLGDRVGRRRLLLMGAAAFGVASVMTAFAPTAELLIAARAMLGIAAACLAPSTLSLIRNMFLDDGQRTFAIAVWVMSFSAGAAIGPVLGGLVLEYFWWGAVFLLAVPVMALLLVAGPAFLPEFRDAHAGRLDPISAMQSLAAVLAVIYGLKEIAQEGFGWMPALSVSIGIVVGVVFIRRQRTLRHPLIDLQLFANRAFSVALTANTLDFFVGFGISLFIAQYLQVVLGLSPLQAGLWTVPWACGFIVGSLLTPRLVRHARPAYVMAWGMALAALGFGVLTQVGSGSSLAILVIGTVVLSLGLAPMTTLATDTMLAAAPPERAGAASAISETSSELGGALGIAVLGSIGTAVYRQRVTAAIPPGVPPEAGEAARETIGAAMVAASRLPEHPAAELVDAARSAFGQSFELAAGVSAVIAIGTAILVAIFLRDGR
jgi:DHA2 family multidrug resistance protein-like MFS transporter